MFIDGLGIPERLSSRHAPFQLVDADYEVVQKTIMPLVGWNGSALAPMGTCFVVSPIGVALTAWHVIEQFVNTYGPATHRGDAGLYAILETPGSVTSPRTHLFEGLVPVTSVANSDQDDLCALKLGDSQDTNRIVDCPALRLNVGVPKVGESCAAIGYPIMSLDGEVLRRQHPVQDVSTIEYDRRLAVSRGHVEEIYPAGRPKLRFPCFLTNARHDHGMSGGPVITKTGGVIGIVCTGFNMSQGLPQTSFASLLGPVLQLGVAKGDEVKILLELWQENELDIVGFDEIVVGDERTTPPIAYVSNGEEQEAEN